MHKFTRLIAALGFAATATAAVAAPQLYTADADHTFPRFSYNHLGFSTQVSRFNTTEAQIVLDKEARTAAVEVTIDMRSVDTGSAAFDEHIQAPDLFDTAKYPTATFKSTRVIFDGDKPSRIEGNLTIKGITKPVTLTVTSFRAMKHPMLEKDAIGADATTVIKRSDFNAGMFAPAVSDEVRIDIAIEAVAQ